LKKTKNYNPIFSTIRDPRPTTIHITDTIKVILQAQISPFTILKSQQNKLIQL